MAVADIEAAHAASPASNRGRKASAIGLPSQTGGTILCLDGQIHHDTHAVPMGNYVIGVGKYADLLAFGEAFAAA